MEKTMHKAAQYLATSAISFIAKKEDDSHTNLGWLRHTLETHPFPNGDKLSLNYKHFSLEWTHNSGNKDHLPLENRTHKEVVDWIVEVSSKKTIDKVYSYKLHYELPYNDMVDTFRFRISDKDELHYLIKKSDIAQYVISQVLEINQYKSPIRIWPHHFDTGAFVTIDNQLSIGLGMAMPDAVIDDSYFYISGYNGHSPIDLKLTKNNTKGYYQSNGWKGFALPVSGIDADSAIEFCQKAITEYLNLIE